MSAPTTDGCNSNTWSASNPSQDNKMQTIDEYIESHSSAEPEVLRKVAHRTNVQILNPRMMCGHVEGRLLSLIAHMVHPRRILELGTFTGYSALCLAEGLIEAEDAEVVTIDRNDELEDFVQENLSLSPYRDRIRCVVGDAMEEIGKLDGAFDLIFIDADKREYEAYLDAVLPLCHPGTIILADNTLWDGHITDPQYDRDRQTIGLRAFNDRVVRDERLETVLLPLRDGLTIIRVK